MDEILQEIGSNLYNGEVRKVSELVKEALKKGFPPNEILSDGLITGMDKVGKDFKAGILFVPEVLRTAMAMTAGMEVLRPLLAQGDGGFITDKFLIGTVKGDLHDIGKNLVKMMLEGAGFEVIDLGTDVSPEAFVAAARQHQPKIIAMSALLTTTMSNMKVIIEALSNAGLRDSVKVLIGGAPVTAAFATHIGADAYAPDAANAVDTARNLVSLSKN